MIARLFVLTSAAAVALSLLSCDRILGPSDSAETAVIVGGLSDGTLRVQRSPALVPFRRVGPVPEMFTHINSVVWEDERMWMTGSEDGTFVLVEMDLAAGAVLTRRRIASLEQVGGVQVRGAYGIAALPDGGLLVTGVRNSEPGIVALDEDLAIRDFIPFTVAINALAVVRAPGAEELWVAAGARSPALGAPAELLIVRGGDIDTAERVVLETDVGSITHGGVSQLAVAEDGAAFVVTGRRLYRIELDGLDVRQIDIPPIAWPRIALDPEGGSIFLLSRSGSFLAPARIFRIPDDLSSPPALFADLSDASYTPESTDTPALIDFAVSRKSGHLLVVSGTSFLAPQFPPQHIAVHAVPLDGEDRIESRSFGVHGVPWVRTR